MRISVDDIEAEVVFKDIRNIHLSVHPPDGRVRISAPRRMGRDAIRAFVVSKQDWIRRHRKRLREQERKPPIRYQDGESHLLWGKPCRLIVIEDNAAPRVELERGTLVLRVRPGMETESKRNVVQAWYREQLRQAAVPLIVRWEPIMGVKVKRISVRRMKTRWGSCTHRAGTIRFNTELARRPPEFLEYLVVHEMVHLLEPTHGARFAALMDRFLPDWRDRRKRLNRQPITDEEREG